MGKVYEREQKNGHKREVVSHQRGLSSGWSFIRVVSDQGGLSLGWSPTGVFFHKGGLLSGWSFIRVVSYWCILLSGWSFIRVVSSYWHILSSGCIPMMVICRLVSSSSFLLLCSVSVVVIAAHFTVSLSV